MNDPVANATRASLEGIDSLVARLHQALLRQDAAACAALFADDALMLSPYGPPVSGRDQIRETHQAWFDEGETNKRLQLLEAGVSGDLGYCVLAYAGDYPQPDGSYATDRGRSVNVLRRQADGRWQIHVSSLNADQA